MSTKALFSVEFYSVIEMKKNVGNIISIHIYVQLRCLSEDHAVPYGIINFFHNEIILKIKVGT